MFLRLLCTGKDPAEYEDDNLLVHRCVLSIAQDMIFWGFRRENANPKAYVVRIINKPGNMIKGTCISAECSWSLCQL